ncbi:amidase [Anaerocolumna cellulosilytica]|uniref:Amidase n=1 Tax=Anaerocolumna cellulosilytica TaxID=433286 RepID=A0A6S6QT32_9FIRM|nr:amidase family protein [Anaerocolumna cellulosilytica]MBB5195523.1 amidase [Anaerocolumna cellulosilytica]BCJ93764.1 amidase [Anaerocolumna cellulosilytica]
MRNIYQFTINELQILLQSKKISVKELVNEYIKRIKTLDKGLDGLNSIIELNPAIEELANKVDERGVKNSGTLAGIPILLKDNINTGDTMHTSAGSLALENSYAIQDADIARLLREQGAIFLGKTNMTEFANYMTEGMPAGYSSRGGQVISPYKKSGDPSGSSTGSGVAAAAGFCGAAIGTDTSNSIVGPSLNNSLVGLRPSAGSISIKGIIPISFTLDAAGPMARSVIDTAVLYSVLTKSSIPLVESYNLSGITIGINRWRGDTLTKEEWSKYEEVITMLKKAGAKIKDITIEPIKFVKKIMKYEFKYGLNKYLSELPATFPIRSLSDIIDFNNRHPEVNLKYGQKYLIEAEEETRGDLQEESYKEALNDRVAAIQRINNIFRTIDMCIMLKDNNILQYTGMPVITIPCGLYKSGMPFGLTVTAKSDRELIQYAFILEKLVGHRVEPPL